MLDLTTANWPSRTAATKAARNRKRARCSSHTRVTKGRVSYRRDAQVHRG